MCRQEASEWFPIIVTAWDHLHRSQTARDNGIGIPPAAQQHLFKRFYRVSGEREQTFPGLGMGLYIAHEIIKQHGGKYSSRKPGRQWLDISDLTAHQSNTTLRVQEK